MIDNGAWQTHQLEASYYQQDRADELPAPRTLAHYEGSASWYFWKDIETIPPR